MRLAYLIIAHKNFGQLAKLIKLLYHKDTVFYIHIDIRVDISSHSTILNELTHFNNVYFVKERIKTTWGGSTLMETILHLLNTVTKNQSYDYINLLSGQDLPIKSNDYIFNFLYRNKNKEFIEYFALPDSTHWAWNGGFDRFRYFWLIDELGLQESTKFVKAQKDEGITRIFPNELTPFGGSCWFTITSSCAKYICDFVVLNPKILNFFKYTFCSDEMFIHTIILNSPFKEDVINNNLRYIDWRKGPQFPRILTVADYDTLRNSGALFARKFDSSRYNKIIVKLVNDITS